LMVIMICVFKDSQEVTKLDWPSSFSALTHLSTHIERKIMAGIYAPRAKPSMTISYSSTFIKTFFGMLLKIEKFRI
jgi:hypothetical protein